MKLILRESVPVVKPDLWLVFFASDVFSPTYYLDKGYTKADVYLVGGGGGGGAGGISTDPTPYDTCGGGGGGGGGGARVVRGLLLAGITVGTPVTVGSGGLGGPDHTDGSDGGASSFESFSIFGGAGGGKAWGPPDDSAAGSGGGGGGSDYAASPGHGPAWPGGPGAPDQWAAGGAGAHGGGDGGDTTDFTVGSDNFNPGKNGWSPETDVYGGGGGGGGANRVPHTRYLAGIDGVAGAGGKGYHTNGSITFAQIKALSGTTATASAGGGGGGGIDADYLTGQSGLTSGFSSLDTTWPTSLFGPRFPGEGGLGGAGWADSTHTHAGVKGANGLVIFRFYV